MLEIAAKIAAKIAIVNGPLEIIYAADVVLLKRDAGGSFYNFPCALPLLKKQLPDNKKEGDYWLGYLGCALYTLLTNNGFPDKAFLMNMTVLLL